MKHLIVLFLCISTGLITAQNKKYYYEYESVLPHQERFDKIDIKAYNEIEKIHLYGTLLMPKTPFEKSGYDCSGLRTR